MKILHAPWNVAGQPAALALAERGLGHDSRSVAIANTQYGHGADQILAKRLGPVSLLRGMTRLRRTSRTMDVVHLNFGAPLAAEQMPLAESSGLGRLARRLWNSTAARDPYRGLKECGRGRVLAVTFQGTDARLPTTMAQTCKVHPYGEPTPADAERERLNRRRIEAFSENAHLMYALNPDLLQHLPDHAQFLPYAHVDARDVRFSPQTGHAVPKVIHAPTDRRFKGTGIILEAIDQLKKEGVAFDFELIEGVRHDQMSARYAAADLFIDQVLVGWYGGAAVEAMAHGCPTLAYLRRSDLQYIPALMRAEIPVLNAGPDELVDVLRRELTDPARLAARRGPSRAYVERWHDPEKIAAGTIADYHRIREQRSNDDDGRPARHG